MPKETSWSTKKIDAPEHPKIISKSLPKILDDMDENIRAAAEAARRSEEAARAAKQAADFATLASSEVAKMIERLYKDLKINENNNAYQAITAIIRKEVAQQNELLEDRIKNIEARIPKQKTIILREISREDAKSEIEELFIRGDILYYSDIAEKLRIDLELVVEICDELGKEGKVKVANRPQ
jgi:hypothetical protein